MALGSQISNTGAPDHVMTANEQIAVRVYLAALWLFFGHDDDGNIANRRRLQSQGSPL